jgi:hypothetical protein
VVRFGPMPAPDPRIGTTLHDRYRVLERMTEGSMGVVYRGERVRLHRPVAIKFLSEGYAASEDAMRRFEVEARAMSRLQHPNCVGVIDFGLDQGAPYLVMDFIVGRTLRQILQQEGRFRPSRALGILRQVLAGLAHAHAQSIIHRDVKPENILVQAVEGHGEQVRILDFGLAKLRDEGSVTTGVAVGTPGYMSPEQTAGEKVDQRADLYATGIILFELLTGQKPFRSEIIFEVLRMHRETPPPTLESLAPDQKFSRALSAVVMRALAKNRDDRFSTAAEFLTAIDETPEGSGASEAPPLLPERGSRRRVLVAACAVVLLAAAGGGVWAWTRRQRASTAAAPAPAPAKPKKRRVETTAAGTTPGAAGSGTTAPGETAAGAEEPADDGATDDAAPAEVAAPGPSEPDDVRKLRERAAGGDLAGAVRALENLHRREPARAEVSYALGNMYAELQLWPAAVKAYDAALSSSAAYRQDERLIGDVVEALASDRAHPLASTLIRTELGQAALPRLQQATRSSTPRLRARARKLRAQLLHK